MKISYRSIFLIGLLVIFFSATSYAGEKGVWQLVDIFSGTPKQYKDNCSEEKIQSSNGSFKFEKHYFKGRCNNNNDAVFSATATWPQPPSKLYPGESIPLTASVVKGGNITGLFLNCGIDISMDSKNCDCGGKCGGKTIGVASVHSNGMSTSSINKVFKVPDGAEGGVFALRYCPTSSAYYGQPGFRYIYQWVQAEENKDSSAGHKSKGKVEPETTEYTWSDYAKEFEEVYTPEQQAEAIARMTPKQRAELDRARAELKTKKPEDLTKKRKPRPVPDMTREQYLIKSWDFEQGIYRSYEKDMFTHLDICLEEMEKSKEKLRLIKKSYEKEFDRPLPIVIDYTATRYPPQTPKQKEALRIYEQFKTTSEAYEQAKDLESDWIKDLRKLPFVNTQAGRESGEAATRDREALEEQLNQIKKGWTDDLHRDFGPLKKAKTIPDPQHDPVDPRKKRRQVDAMEYKIKGGAQYEKRYTGNGTTSTTSLRFSKPPEQNSAESKKTNIPVDRSEERELQSLGQKNTAPRGSQTLPSVRDEGIPKGHTTKYGF